MTQSARYRKSRSGCITCKTRKVKCDETHPACRRCTSTGRVCDGYAAVPRDGKEAVGYLVFQHVDEWCLPPDENRALFYFQHVTAPSLLNLDSASFWSRTTLQICHQEDALKHLIVAVSLADEQRMCFPSDLSNERVDSRHLYHYGKALKLLSSPQQPKIWLILMASLLLCVYEDLQFRELSALQHITSGRNIMLNYGKQKLRGPQSNRPCPGSLMEELVPIFAKLERQTWEFDLETLNLRSGVSLADLCRLGQRPDISQRTLPVPSKFTQPTSPPILFPWTTAFESLDHANRWLHALRPRGIASHAVAQPPATRFHIVPAITYQLNMWLESLHVFVRLASQNLSMEDLVTISVLRTFQLCLHVLSQTVPFNSEMLFDKHAHVLEHIIQRLPCYFDQTKIDLTPALWLAATKSRNFLSRRQAVEMLRRTNHMADTHAGRGEILARAAEKVIELEEENLGPMSSCGDIPGRSRIRVFGIELVDERDECVVLFKRSPHDESAGFDVATVDLEGVGQGRGTDLRLEGALSFDWMALDVCM